MAIKKTNRRSKELELSSFTLDNLQEAVLWIASDGKILQVNDKTCQLSGYTQEELKSMSIQQLNPTDIVADFSAYWRQLKNAKSLVFESKHLHKTGYTYDVEIRGNYIELDGIEFSCSIVTDIRKKKLEQELLRTVSEYTAAFTGSDFFQELTKHISAVLNVRYALVTECSNEEKTRVRTLSYVDHQELRENIEYDLQGTPCEIVMKGKDYFCANELEKQFPREKGINSYVAVPIYSPVTKEVIGHIAAFDNIPMLNMQNQIDILRIFAARAGSEIERINVQKKLNQALQAANNELQVRLKESEERYRDLFDEAPIAYVHEGLDSRFIRANRAALRILGLRAEDVPTIYGKSLVAHHPENLQRLEAAFSSIAKGIDTGGVLLELRRKDNGKPIWIQWWSKPDPSGEFTRTMFLDITQQVLMEKERALLKAENQYLQEEIKLNHNFQDIISISKKFQKVLQQIEQVAETDATVLITGESGTGKELIARAIHNISNRRRKPLVKVNCAALPANLIESELFGHERGAFTGAMEKKIGRFELADGGTIFLDEIGELPVELQAKLLRVLQEGEFERLGNARTTKVNVRVIAATNRNLEMAIQKKEFREDLYYRLNVFPLHSPPLRERKEDIPLLIKHFCQKHETKIGKKVTTIPSNVMDALIAYDWPGNIRELENIIERALILSRNETIEFGEWMPMAKSMDAAKSKKLLLEDVEREQVIRP
jgi:PAS domain S-box-containing protein